MATHRVVTVPVGRSLDGLSAALEEATSGEEREGRSLVSTESITKLGDTTCWSCSSSVTEPPSSDWDERCPSSPRRTSAGRR